MREMQFVKYQCIMQKPCGKNTARLLSNTLIISNLHFTAENTFMGENA
jgi:hypothetical protein